MSIEEGNLAELLSVDEARQRILSQFSALPSEKVALSVSLGRVLAEDIIANINIPPHANSSMDGFAVRAADLQNASQHNPAKLTVVMDIPAGTFPSAPINLYQAARIMTGAPVPAGADAVIPVESTDAQWSPGDNTPLPSSVSVFRALKSGDYIRPAGEDMEAGQTILPAGTIIRSAEMGVLAALGQAGVSVISKPRVIIISTGDELIEPGYPLSSGKIYDSNSYMIMALIESIGGVPHRMPIAPDSKDDIRRTFAAAIAQHPDLIISSAGVSVGAFDAVRSIIDELGAVNFWRVNVRPGKPLAFGHLAGIPFFGLPGNPVSAMVTFHLFVNPAVLKLGNRPDEQQIIKAVIADDMESDGRRSYFRVKLTRENEVITARLTGTQSSSALTSMVAADGLLVVPEGKSTVKAGEAFDVLLLRSLTLI